MTRTRRGFTLLELIVSIGAIAILSLGIGRVFRSVSDLVGVGSASAEVDQIARAIERQMRDDFEAASLLSSEDQFLAIRMREVGDVNRNGVLDEGETAVYLSIDDRDADALDIQNGLLAGPYDSGSRAVTRRVDEMMFLGQASGEGYRSYQSPRELVNDASRRIGFPTARFARIYYGHGLKPRSDANWPPAGLPDTAPLPPKVRSFIPDGDFGQSANPVPGADMVMSAGPDNRFAPAALAGASRQVTGRNEFGAEWCLLRHTLLLMDSNISGRGAQVTSSTEFAPFPRDAENEARIRFNPDGTQVDMRYTALLDDSDLTTFGLAEVSPPLTSADLLNLFPYPRPIRGGRVDICAMSPTNMKNWLEGDDPSYSGGAASAAPFSSGYLTDQVLAMQPLWARTDSGSPQGVYADNLTGAQMAIAGMMQRITADPDPPVATRDIQSDTPSTLYDEKMDLHAIISSQCSNFEIAWAWADRSVASEDLFVDGEIVYNEGDTVWFDITPLQEGADPVRSSADYWLDLNRADGIAIDRSRINVAEDAEISQGEIFQNEIAAFVTTGFEIETDANSVNPRLYFPDVQGGADYASAAGEGASEQLVIFPYRAPLRNGSGDYDDEGYPKSVLIRVRITLHDALNRIDGGKQYEFIFPFTPGS